MPVFGLEFFESITVTVIGLNFSVLLLLSHPVSQQGCPTLIDPRFLCSEVVLCFMQTHLSLADLGKANLLSLKGSFVASMYSYFPLLE